MTTWCSLSLLAFFLSVTEYSNSANGFINTLPLAGIKPFVHSDDSWSCLNAKSKSKSKQKKKGSGSSVGFKGFGGSVAISSSPSPGASTKAANNDNGGVRMDESRSTRAFYEFLDQNGAGDNLKRTALAHFNLPNGESIRGVVATKDIPKGSNIIRIPYELAINLGREGGNPTGPGFELLLQYCNAFQGKQNQQGDENIDKKPYFEMLPEFGCSDCMKSTDFWSEDALSALQTPPIIQETLDRKEIIKRKFLLDIEPNRNEFPPWVDGSDLTEQHLRWAAWLVTSRVVTVEGPMQENAAYKCLIPLLDMCNHDRSSVHILTGRAVPGGELKVVAGKNVERGEQIFIPYGGGVAGNDRFLQDYGFLDEPRAYDIVADQIMGRRRGGGRKLMTLADQKATLERLQETGREDDVELLKTEMDPATKVAIEFRLGLKDALSKHESDGK